MSLFCQLLGRQSNALICLLLPTFAMRDAAEILTAADQNSMVISQG